MTTATFALCTTIFSAGVAVGAVCGMAIGRWSQRIGPFALLAALAGSVAAQTPAADLRAALADAEKLGPASAVQARYLSLCDYPEKRRDELTTAINYAVNALSRVRKISPVVPVSPTVLRIDVSLFVNDAHDLDQWTQAWADLATDDPYFHLPTQVLAGGKVQTVVVASPAGNATADVRLRQLTDTPSRGAMLRGSWFVGKALEPPYYYQFIGVPEKEADWFQAQGIDPQVVQRLSADAAANLFVSGITNKPRRIVAIPSPLGTYYKTLDVKRADARRDPFKRPIDKTDSKAAFDASEVFSLGRNGFWQTAIFDSAGNRQDAVLDEIAVDRIALDEGADDGRVTAGASCFRCHATSGLNQFSDDLTRLLRTQHSRISLSAKDPNDLRRLLELYDEPRLQNRMAFDRQQHELAVARACNCKPQEAVAALAAVVKRVEYDKVDALVVSEELSIPWASLPEVIDGTHDPSLAAIVEGQAIQRGTWEAAYPEAGAKAASWHQRNP